MSLAGAVPFWVDTTTEAPVVQDPDNESATVRLTTSDSLLVRMVSSSGSCSSEVASPVAGSTSTGVEAGRNAGFSGLGAVAVSV